MNAKPASRQVYVVFGAAVRPDGSPSGSLYRRTEGALRAALEDPDSFVLVSGGLGRYPPPEHEVMADILIAGGLGPERILHDGTATDTLDTVFNSIALIESLETAAVPCICTSAYHAPRCWALFHVLGLPAKTIWLGGDWSALGPGKFMFYCLRECAALIWDVSLALKHRIFSPRDG